MSQSLSPSQKFTRDICRSVGHDYGEDSVCDRCYFNGYIRTLKQALETKFLGAKITGELYSRIYLEADHILKRMVLTEEIQSYENLQVAAVPWSGAAYTQLEVFVYTHDDPRAYIVQMCF